MQARAWQAVESVPQVGTRVLGFVELDFARSAGDVNESGLQYVSFESQQPTRLALDFAQYLSRLGAQAPALRSVLVVCRGDASESFYERYPGFLPITYNGDIIVSADPAEVAIIRTLVQNAMLSIEGKRPVLHDSTAGAPIDPALSRAVIDRLWWEGRLLYLPAGARDFRGKKIQDRTIDLVVPFSPRANYLSTAAADLRALVAFNAGFYCYFEEEFSDPYTFVHDNGGLVIENGRVTSAPVYQRSALLVCHRVFERMQDERLYSLSCARPVIRKASLVHYALELPGNVIVRGELFRRDRILKRFGPKCKSVFTAQLNPQRVSSGEAAFYNRMIGIRNGGSTWEHTPGDDGRIEFSVVGNSVCAVRESGGTYIPRHGFVVSLPRTDMTEPIIEQIYKTGCRIRQDIDLGPDVIEPSSGVQVGLQLVRDGHLVDIASELDSGNDEYVPLRKETDEKGILPIFLDPHRLVSSRMGLVGFGVRPDGRCYVVTVEGCEPRTQFPEFDSVGASQPELARYMLQLGCCDAVALDSGGSAQVVFDGRPLIRVADRHDVPLLPDERIIPGGWMVKIP